MPTTTHDEMAATATEQVAALTLPEAVTVTRITWDAAITFSVRRYGIKLGTIAVGARTTNAHPTGARWATYRFATAQDAVNACVSYADRGYWTNEI